MKNVGIHLPVASCAVQPFDLGYVCVRLCDHLDDIARANDVRLSAQIAPSALGMFVGDEGRFFLAISSLTRYAIARAKGGSVKLQVKAGPNGRGVVVKVADTGSCHASEPALDFLIARCACQFLRGRLRRRNAANGLASVTAHFPFSPAAFTQPNHQARARLFAVETNQSA